MDHIVSGLAFAEETEGKHLTAGATTGFFGAESLDPAYNWDSWIMSIYGISENLFRLNTNFEVTGGIVRGTGKTIQSMAIVIINLCAVRVFLLGILTKQFHTVQAVASVYPVTWALAAVSFAVYYFFLYYRKPVQEQKHFPDMESMAK